jgi:hypothetical protein
VATCFLQLVRDGAWAKQIGGVTSPSNNHLGEVDTYKWSAGALENSLLDRLMRVGSRRLAKPPVR